MRGRGFFLEMQNFELFRDMGIDEGKSYKSCLLSPPNQFDVFQKNKLCKLFYTKLWCILVAFLKGRERREKGGREASSLAKKESSFFQLGRRCRSVSPPPPPSKEAVLRAKENKRGRKEGRRGEYNPETQVGWREGGRKGCLEAGARRGEGEKCLPKNSTD